MKRSDDCSERNEDEEFEILATRFNAYARQRYFSSSSSNITPTSTPIRKSNVLLVMYCYVVNMQKRPMVTMNVKSVSHFL